MKRWQDVVFGVGGFYFALTLLPVILDPSAYVPLWTSVPTSAFLALYAVAWHSMGATRSTLGGLASFTAWLLVAVFRGVPP